MTHGMMPMAPAEPMLPGGNWDGAEAPALQSAPPAPPLSIITYGVALFIVGATAGDVAATDGGRGPQALALAYDAHDGRDLPEARSGCIEPFPCAAARRRPMSPVDPRMAAKQRRAARRRLGVGPLKHARREERMKVA